MQRLPALAFPAWGLYSVLGGRRFTPFEYRMDGLWPRPAPTNGPVGLRRGREGGRGGILFPTEQGPRATPIWIGVAVRRCFTSDERWATSVDDPSLSEWHTMCERDRTSARDREILRTAPLVGIGGSEEGATTRISRLRPRHRPKPCAGRPPFFEVRVGLPAFPWTAAGAGGGRVHA